MKKNKYLLLGSSVGALLLFGAAAVEENFLREWRRIQARAPISRQLRQIVNPSLRIADRCVSCHVSMAPGEQGLNGAKVLAAHRPVVHDPAEYGCTVCHGGQGQATEREDAHGHVHFWPEPMLPARYSQAGCGTCHAPLGIPSRRQYARAAGAFERLDCLACHRVDGRGGTIRPDGGGMEGTDLSRAGLTGWNRGWYEKHLVKSKQAVTPAWKLAFSPIQAEDLRLLDAYLATCVAAPMLVEAKSVFHSAGCLGCHRVSGVGGDQGVDLTRAGEKDPGQVNFSSLEGPARLDRWMADHLRSPGSLVAGSQMPSLGLSEREIDLLTMYTLSLRRKDLPGTYLPKDRLRAERFKEREFAGDGETLFGAFCAGCHGPEGKGLRSAGVTPFPSIASPEFLALASDEFLVETVRKGRAGRKMPAWGAMDGGLRPDEIQKVVAYLRGLGGVPYRPESTPRRWVRGDAGSGKRLYAAVCSGCHGARGEGNEGPALNNRNLLEAATDTFLVETIRRGRGGTDMAGFATPSPVRPALEAREIESVMAYLRSFEGGKK